MSILFITSIINNEKDAISGYYDNFYIICKKLM